MDISLVCSYNVEFASWTFMKGLKLYITFNILLYVIAM